MLISLFALFGAQALYAAAGIISHTHTVHEKRQSLANTQRWIRRDRVHARATLPVRIGLKQDNLNYGHDWLMRVSHPDSADYGKFWSSEDVIKAFQPSAESVKAVRDWVVNVEGIDGARVTHSENKGWLAFEATADEIERLLRTTLYHYEHSDTGSVYVAAEEYRVPRSVQAHVDYITPGVKGVKIASGLRKRTLEGSHRSGQPLMYEASFTSSDPNSLETCDKVITPACIRALYDFEQPDPFFEPCPGNAIGVFQEGNFYSQEDLDGFFTNFTRGAYQIPNGTHPTLVSIDGGSAPVPVSEAGGEPDLDFDLVYPIVYPQNVTLYQTDDSWYATSGNFTGMGAFNTFLDALDGSYCTYCAFGECGNDPVQDPTYPDPQPGGYVGKLQCGVFKPTNVISISYGQEEHDLPAAYQQRQCNEFLKLGLQGVSIFIASGDDGVAGRPGEGHASANGCIGQNGTVFSPAEPVTCPYLTSVGGTKVMPGKTPFDPESALIHENKSPNDPYSSGGGFSNIYPVPDYQRAALDAYFASYDPPYAFYTDGHYNSSGGGRYNRNGRGFPDVAAVADNIAVHYRGKFALSGGTSASTPIFASLINRIIEERIAIGKGPVGFINPVLYSNPWVLNDITNGSNPGCGTNGFDAVPGWDPVTGLGTANYPLMLGLFLALP
ncbi:hypothetical protein ANO11243_005720 [Dothideomycetidae sp. 11243]|nr:hypothetical protein ANO11243_005720 [fungal sp. No.11243]